MIKKSLMDNTQSIYLFRVSYILVRVYSYELFLYSTICTRCTRTRTRASTVRVRKCLLVLVQEKLSDFASWHVHHQCRRKQRGTDHLGTVSFAWHFMRSISTCHPRCRNRTSTRVQRNSFSISTGTVYSRAAKGARSFVIVASVSISSLCVEC